MTDRVTPLPCFIYSAPNGKKTASTIVNIRQQERDFFTENELVVSLEQLQTDRICLYSTLGPQHPSDTEIVYVVPENQSCEDAMSRLRELVMSGWCESVMVR